MRTISLQLFTFLLILTVNIATASITIPTMEAISNNTYKNNSCQYYVDTSLQQNALNKKHHCGFTGSRWNDDKKGQFQWCMGALERASRAETDARTKLLETCISQKAAVDNPENQPKLPTQCKSSDPKKQAVKMLYRYFHYKTELDQPIADGLIRYDYNGDKKEDYLFLERYKDYVEVMLCLSSAQSYQRQKIGITFDAKGGDLDEYRYYIKQVNNQLNIDINFFGHNQGSSYRLLSYIFDKKKNIFVETKNETGSSPVYYDGQPYPLGAPDTPTILNLKVN